MFRRARRAVQRVVVAGTMTAVMPACNGKDAGANRARVTEARQPRADSGTAMAHGASDTIYHGHAGVVVGALVIWLDSTTMREVTMALGYDAIVRTPEGIAILACFETAGDHRTFLRLEAHGQDTSPLVTAEIASEHPQPSILPRCTRLLTRATEVRTTMGIHLGIARIEADRLLGAPQSVTGDVVEYDIPLIAPTRDTTTSRSNGLRRVHVALEFRGGVVVRATLSQGNEFINAYP
jgi:hypothetical protein